MKKIIFAIISILVCAQIAGCGSSAQSASQKKEYLTELPEIKDGEYPEQFDLRDYGYVTSVKSQGELGYCWAFATIAASESSILSELHTTAEESGLDLSEHHLAWFAKQHIPAEGEEGYDADNTQSGEGYYTDSWQNSSWTQGADPLTAILTFSSGIGPASEEAVPYKGKNGTVSENDDWSVSEDLRFSGEYDLERAYILPTLAADGDSLSEDGIAAVKEMLTQGRAVAVAYKYSGTEESVASDNSESPYLNEKTYAHYTYDQTSTDHCVTIVGWDDTYSKDNFNEGHRPAGDGAWIVKNSWGAATENGSNYSSWGIDGSGYFYISYYDQSLAFACAFDFDTTTAGSAYDILQQYDYLTAYSLPYSKEEKVQEANAFETEEDMELEAVGTLCSAENVKVTYEVYLLENGSENPSDGTLAVSMEKDYKYSGYYREVLDEPVSLSKGQKYAVVITQTSADGSEYYYQYTNAADGQESIVAMFTGTYEKGVVNKGESYIYFEDSGWQEFTAYIEEDEGENSGMVADDNFCIKAFGNKKQ